MRPTYAETVTEIRALREQWRRAANSYAQEPFAGTRDLNKNDEARERMAASRAEKRNRP